MAKLYFSASCIWAVNTSALKKQKVGMALASGHTCHSTFSTHGSLPVLPFLCVICLIMIKNFWLKITFDSVPII